MKKNLKKRLVMGICVALLGQMNIGSAYGMALEIPVTGGVGGYVPVPEPDLSEEEPSDVIPEDPADEDPDNPSDGSPEDPTDGDSYDPSILIPLWSDQFEWKYIAPQNGSIEDVADQYGFGLLEYIEARDTRDGDMRQICPLTYDWENLDFAKTGWQTIAYQVTPPEGYQFLEGEKTSGQLSVYVMDPGEMDMSFYYLEDDNYLTFQWLCPLENYTEDVILQLWDGNSQEWTDYSYSEKPNYIWMSDGNHLTFYVPSLEMDCGYKIQLEYQGKSSYNAATFWFESKEDYFVDVIEIGGNRDGDQSQEELPPLFQPVIGGGSGSSSGNSSTSDETDDGDAGSTSGDGSAGVESEPEGDDPADTPDPGAGDLDQTPENTDTNETPTGNPVSTDETKSSSTVEETTETPSTTQKSQWVSSLFSSPVFAAGRNSLGFLAETAGLKVTSTEEQGDTPTAVMEQVDEKTTVITGERLKKLMEVSSDGVSFEKNDISVNLSIEFLKTLNVADNDTIRVEIQGDENQFSIMLYLGNEKLTKIPDTLVYIQGKPGEASTTVAYENEDKTTVEGVYDSHTGRIKMTLSAAGTYEKVHEIGDDVSMDEINTEDAGTAGAQDGNLHTQAMSMANPKDSKHREGMALIAGIFALTGLGTTLWKRRGKNDKKRSH